MVRPLVSLVFASIRSVARVQPYPTPAVRAVDSGSTCGALPCSGSPLKILNTAATLCYKPPPHHKPLIGKGWVSHGIRDDDDDSWVGDALGGGGGGGASEGNPATPAAG